jgi:hypothetical protein
MLEYFSGMKSKEVLTYVTTQIYFEDIIQSEITWHKKKKIVWFYLYETLRVVIITDVASRV